MDTNALFRVSVGRDVDWLLLLFVCAYSCSAARWVWVCACPWEGPSMIETITIYCIPLLFISVSLYQLNVSLVLATMPQMAQTAVAPAQCVMATRVSGHHAQRWMTLFVKTVGEERTPKLPPPRGEHVILVLCVHRKARGKSLLAQPRMTLSVASVLAVIFCTLTPEVVNVSCVHSVHMTGSSFTGLNVQRHTYHLTCSVHQVQCYVETQWNLYYVAMGSRSLWTAGCLCRSCCAGLVSATRTSDHSNKMLSDHYRPVHHIYMNVSQKSELATVHNHCSGMQWNLACSYTKRVSCSCPGNRYIAIILTLTYTST